MNWQTLQTHGAAVRFVVFDSWDVIPCVLASAAPHSRANDPYQLRDGSIRCCLCGQICAPGTLLAHKKATHETFGNRLL